MQNVSNEIGRPLRVRTAVLLTALALAAAAVVAIATPYLGGASAPATTSAATRATVKSTGSSLVSHNRSEEGLGITIQAAGGQSGDSQPVRGKPF